jgi:UV DNA damage endonuclease
VGGAYGNKSEAIERFNENFKRLPATASSRLTIENDDKANMFSVADLVAVHESCGIPIVFDYLHHKFCTGDLSEEEAFKLAISTWPERVTPAVHFSSEKKIYEDKNAVATAHADFVYTLPRTYGHDVDVMLEAKAKELALERFQSQFRSDRVTA